MSSRVHESATIWSCAACSGVFLPAQQLRAIMADEAAPRSEQERRAAIAAAVPPPPAEQLQADVTACPWCTQDMQRVNYGVDSGVLIDRCDSCGILLDAGELERLEAWAEATRSGGTGIVSAPRATADPGADDAPTWTEFQRTDRDRDLGYQLRGMTGTHAPWEDGGLGDSIVDAVLTEHRRKRREQAKEQDLLAWAERQRRAGS
jgi:Zn-finger nucleic acid-binding protein